MSHTSRRLRSVAAVALAAGLVLGAAACSNEPEEAADGPVTVTLQWFGSPGFDKAVADFQSKNPNIKVDSQNMGQLRDFQPKLVQWLATGSGAGDVVMLEEGTLQEFLVDNKNFANLLDLGAGGLKDDYLPYKWEGGFTADKKKLVGLGTDIGGLAMCYRSDLFGQAGLPTKREDVSKLWANWDDYARVGKQFKAKLPNVAWIDSATSIMQPFIMQQSDTWFYSKDNKLIIDSNPIVRKGYDFGLQMAADGLTAKLGRWSPDWDAAFKNAAFATVPCPAWMTGVIAERAGDAAKGKWDVAEIPGKSGNWGGSYLAIPEQSTKKKQAFELLKYLTSKEGHLSAYAEKGNMPSTISGLDDPAFKDSKNAYFSDAPTGQLFGASAKALKPIHLGPKHQQLWESALEPQMQAAEQGKSTAAAGWAKAVDDAKKLAG
jgi:cellobiose transport system substrate-binding protein